MAGVNGEVTLSTPPKGWARTLGVHEHVRCGSAACHGGRPVRLPVRFPRDGPSTARPATPILRSCPDDRWTCFIGIVTCAGWRRRGWMVPDADAIEQQMPIDDVEEREDNLRELPTDVDPADAVEQHRSIGSDDAEDYPRG